MTGNVLLRQEVETSPLSGGDGLIGERGEQQGRATESCPHSKSAPRSNGSSTPSERKEGIVRTAAS